MTRQEFEDKLKNKTFKEQELEKLRWSDLEIEGLSDEEYPRVIDTIESPDLDRWSRTVENIIKYNNRYYSIIWQEGLTEYQDNIFDNQPEEVIRKTRVIEEVYWELVKNG